MSGASLPLIDEISVHTKRFSFLALILLNSIIFLISFASGLLSATLGNIECCAMNAAALITLKPLSFAYVYSSYSASP